jgi:hypothetical protein
MRKKAKKLRALLRERDRAGRFARTPRKPSTAAMPPPKAPENPAKLDR